MHAGWDALGAVVAMDNELVRNVLFALLASLGKVEAQKISDRTKAGIARARAKGKRIGRPAIGRSYCCGLFELPGGEGTRHRSQDGGALRHRGRLTLRLHGAGAYWFKGQRAQGWSVGSEHWEGSEPELRGGLSSPLHFIQRTLRPPCAALGGGGDLGAVRTYDFPE